MACCDYTLLIPMLLFTTSIITRVINVVYKLSKVLGYYYHYSRERWFPSGRKLGQWLNEKYVVAWEHLKNNHNLYNALFSTSIKLSYIQCYRLYNVTFQNQTFNQFARFCWFPMNCLNYCLINREILLFFWAIFILIYKVIKNY